MIKKCCRCNENLHNKPTYSIIVCGNSDENGGVTAFQASLNLKTFAEIISGKEKVYCFKCIGEICDQLINTETNKINLLSKLTSEEIDFLLLSEEERMNTYKDWDVIWKSICNKLEKQKEKLKDG